MPIRWRAAEIHGGLEPMSECGPTCNCHEARLVDVSKLEFTFEECPERRRELDALFDSEYPPKEATYRVPVDRFPPIPFPPKP